MHRFRHRLEQLAEKVVHIEQRQVTFAAMVGHEPAPLEASHEVTFTDQFDDAYILRLADVGPSVRNKRFPSLAALRAKKASVEPERALRAEHVVRADEGCNQKVLFGPMDQKPEVEKTAKSSEMKKEVPPVPIQGAHLAGAAVLGLRKLAHGAKDNSAHQQNTHCIPRQMMHAALSDVKVSKGVKVPLAPRAPSATPRPASRGKGKRPIPSNMQVLMVPVTC